MTRITKNYDEIKESFLAVFDQLIGEGFVLSDTTKTSFSPAHIANFKKDLTDGKFIVSFCGQIKAGKSSLLNFLIFDGKPILPAAVTPWTAKLTQINFGEQQQALVYFYSQKEWATLKDLIVLEKETPVNYFDRYLRPDVERSAAQGIYAEELIKKDALEITLGDLGQLEDYLTSNGKYTPFVSYVKLFTDNPMVKDLTIVDTPGLNDPNELRSKITTEFINQSSAVVYLFFSTFPLAAADLAFIDRHLSSISSAKIVFGMSRSDLVKDTTVILQYIEENLRTNPELKERNLLKDSRVYPFSTMAALIRQKREKGQPLTEAELFFEKKIPSSLIDKEGLMNEFLRGIEKHIMNDKATTILDSAYSRITAVCLERINRLSGSLGLEEQKILNLGLSAGELDQKITRMKHIREMINRAIEEFGERKWNVTKTVSEDISGSKQAIVRQSRYRFEAWLDSRKIDAALKLSTYEVNSILSEEITKEVKESMAGSAFAKLESFQSELKNRLQKETQEVIPMRRWAFVFAPVIPIRAIVDSSIREVRDRAPEMEKLRARTAWLFTNREGTRANVLGAVYGYIDNTVEEFERQIKSSINAELDKFFTDLKSEILQFLNRYTDDLTKLAADSTDKSRQLKTAQEQAQQLTAQLEAFKRSFAAIESSAGAKWRAYNLQKDSL